MRRPIFRLLLILIGFSFSMISLERPAIAAAGEVLSEQKISATQGGIVGGLSVQNQFGGAIASIGDIDGDGVDDLAAGAIFDSDGGSTTGAVWILLMNADGTLKTETKISAAHGAPPGLTVTGEFGSAIAPLGDLDGNGTPDIAVGARLDDDGGSPRGAVWILFLGPSGAVESYQKISDTAGGFTGVLDNGDGFGISLASPGDLDGDTVPDLAVGADNDDAGSGNAGAVWILFLNSNGSVKAHQKISDLDGAFTGALDASDFFGHGLAALGDLDGDTVPDIAVAAPMDDDGGLDRGAVWVLFMNTNGTVKGHQKISDTAGSFFGVLADADEFGESVATLGDLDGDGVVDLAVGAARDDDGGANRGAAWILFLDADGTVQSDQKISDTVGGFGGVLDDEDRFGSAIAGAGDLDGDDTLDLAVGVPHDDDGGVGQGAVWLLTLNTDGTVATDEKISDLPGAFSEEFAAGTNYFGSAVASLGDLDGDGITDLAVGAPAEDEGRVWLLFLNDDGTVKFDEKIGTNEGGFGGTLDPSEYFGGALERIGDLDGDGVPELIVGAPGSTGGGSVWLAFLNANGTVKAEQEISESVGGFSGVIDVGDQFGISVAALGDLDGDGVEDLAVGAPTDDDGGNARGAVWILFLAADGTVDTEQKISSTSGGFGGTLDDSDRFGSSVEKIGDLDGDGISEIAVGADGDDDGGGSFGAVWILFLNANGSVKSEQKISALAGGFGGTLAADLFGASLASVGDVDGDAIPDLAVGAIWDNDGGFENFGAVWVLFLNSDGTVKSEQKISDTAGSFAGALDANDEFGTSLASLGDLASNGTPNLAVGAVGDDDGHSQAGSVWILTLDGFAASCGDGVVDPVDEVCDDGNNTSGDGCTSDCWYEDEIHVYGAATGGAAEIVVLGETVSVTTLPGDTSGDVATALAAAIAANAGLAAKGVSAAAVGDGVFVTAPIGDASTTDAGLLVHFARLPAGALAAWYDFEGDTEDRVCGRDADIVVGSAFASGYDGQAAEFDGVDDHIEVPIDAGPSERPQLTFGAWVRPDVVGSSRRAILSHDDGGFDRTLGIDDRNVVQSSVGWSAFAGYVGNSDLLPAAGVWTFVAGVYDQASGSARLHVDGQRFHVPLTSVGEGSSKLWIGANPLGVHHFDGRIDDVFLFEKALSIEEVNDVRRLGAAGLNATVASLGPGEPYCREKASATEGGFGGALTDYDEFGRAIEALGDLDGDGVPDAVVAAPVANNGGAIWVTLLQDDGTVKSEQKIGSGAGGLAGPIDSLDLFGNSVGVFPDLDGDGVQDLAVGAIWDDDSANNAGAVHLLFLNGPAGTVASEVKIADTVAGLLADDWFGFAVEVIGDLDGDGVPELAVSAPNDDDGGIDRGAVYILFLDDTGSVVGEQKISDTAGGFAGVLADGDFFGSDLASLGDLDGDDVTELAVGAFYDDTGGTDRGAVWILFLNADGTVKSHQQIADGVGGLTGNLDDEDHFGSALARLGDLDGDGVVDLAVGARKDDDGGPDRGASWVLFLNANGTVKSHAKIGDADGGFGGRVDNADWIGRGLASPGDLDGDGIDDLILGAPRDDDGGTLELGAFYALRLAGAAAVCGDGVQSALEECDDGDADETDGCTSSCEIVPEPGQLGMLVWGIVLLRVLQRRRPA